MGEESAGNGGGICMSFTVFSARSIANDLENAVGEKAFYFYMREIIDGKLYEKYKDGVNGEERKFDGLLQFMQHKDGLGIKDFPLFKKCLGAVASSKHKMQDEANWLLIEINKRQEIRALGENQYTDESPKTQATTQGCSDRTSTRGETSDYLLRRIARDRPELLDDIGKSKRFKSARAAAIEAGIIKDIPSIQLKDPGPTAQKLLAKKGQAWCLQLMDELSELVL
jgi:hypothetical protein